MSACDFIAMMAVSDLTGIAMGTFGDPTRKKVISHS
jgi:hypothetical protein